MSRNWPTSVKERCLLDHDFDIELELMIELELELEFNLDHDHDHDPNDPELDLDHILPQRGPEQCSQPLSLQL